MLSLEVKYVPLWVVQFGTIPKATPKLKKLCQGGHDLHKVDWIWPNANAIYIDYHQLSSTLVTVTPLL